MILQNMLETSKTKRSENRKKNKNKNIYVQKEFQPLIYHKQEVEIFEGPPKERYTLHDLAVDSELNKIVCDHKNQNRHQKVDAMGRTKAYYLKENIKKKYLQILR